MVNELKILCIHGIGHGDADPTLKPAWTAAITANIQRWNPQVAITCEFFDYDDLFDHAPRNPLTYAKAFAKLLASGVFRGIGDRLGGRRGVFELPETIRWTAGMIAQWASEETLREALRRPQRNHRPINAAVSDGVLAKEDRQCFLQHRDSFRVPL